jgi:hypothetical protein
MLFQEADLLGDAFNKLEELDKAFEVMASGERGNLVSFP